MRLAIVGSRSLDGNPEALAIIRQVLDDYQRRHPHLVIISGGAVGIDQMAADLARERGLEVIEHLAEGRTWPHYKKRNLQVAEDCEQLVLIADPASPTYGSGWTADRAREIGRPVTEYMVVRERRRF